MARAAVILTLIAATLIGPCLCVCAWGRAVGQLSETAQTRVPDAPACPHCRAPADTPTAEDPVPADPEHSCPHCDGRAFMPAVAPPTSAPDLGLAFVALLPAVADVPGDTGARTHLTEYPPGRETQAFLLDACHRLRC